MASLGDNPCSRSEGFARHQHAHAFLVPVGDERRQVGVVPGVGIQGQHGAAIDPGPQIADAARRSQRLGLLDREVHATGQMGLHGGSSVVDVDRHGRSHGDERRPGLAGSSLEIPDGAGGSMNRPRELVFPQELDCER